MEIIPIRKEIEDRRSNDSSRHTERISTRSPNINAKKKYLTLDLPLNADINLRQGGVTPSKLQEVVS